jgi:CRISPR-associated endonuclease Csn1
MGKIARRLQQAGLLPEGAIGTGEERLRFFTELDRSISSRYLSAVPEAGPERRRLAHVIPYKLRADALDERLQPHDLGRALYHLAHRRGFLSNRRAPLKADEKPGVVKQNITKLGEEMQEAGARTLGEYFAGLDPEEQRIRARWTSRKMYLDEFERIWEKQSAFHPSILTEEFKKELHDAIFYQRPLKSQKGRVGECQFERGHRRAPMASLEFQRFRMLQRVNDLLAICKADGVVRALTSDERDTLIAELDTKEKVTFGRVRTLLGLRGWTFNLEAGGEKNLVGNKTGAALAKVFGAQWSAFSDADRERIIGDVRSIQKDETLKRRGIGVWGLDEEAAEALSNVRLEDGYCSLSRKALRKILHALEKGESYSKVVKNLYGDRERPVLDYLPSVNQAGIVVSNPAVHRALTELRKVVNAIIREHGKPDKIRIELARDLRQPRKERKRRFDQMRSNEVVRNEARRRILQEAGDSSPSGTDILKVQLADECNWTCPYTGRQINWGTLLGSEPQFDIEHIIPYHRCLDDSFVNKTLCEVAENRNLKKNRTPFEAYAGTERWEEILGRAAEFQGRLGSEKLRRICLEDLSEFEDFSSRLLNDTRYASTLAADYLAPLYGGLSDAAGVLRIHATKGGITAQLRNAWKLNGILSDGPGKSRDDHRHHAVDAIVVALTDANTVKRLSKAAERSFARGERRWWNYVQQPWDGFLEEATQAIERIVVSHRVSRRARGPLHEETYYAHKEGSAYVHVRKALKDLSKKEISDIVDDKVRECVRNKLAGGDPRKAFKSPENDPVMKARDGREIPIHRVRIRKKASVEAVGRGVRQRHVLTGSNHHVEIVERADAKGGVRWKGYVVTTYEAMRRLKNGEPIIKRDHAAREKFLFSLALKDAVRMQGKDADSIVWTVSTISEFTNGTVQLSFVPNADARPVTKVPREGRTRTPDRMRTARCEKIAVTPLGEVRRAND